MKKKYVTIELKLNEFQQDEVLIASPTSGTGSNNTIIDGYENDLL